MSDMTEARRRYLEMKISTAQEALVWCFEMLKARDEMNSKVHCAPIRYSPITDRVGQALTCLQGEVVFSDELSDEAR
jgi:hypothetical protein